MIIVGIDVASEKHDYFMLKKETGESFSSSAITIPNNETGYKKLHEDIQAFCRATGDSNVRIGLESTGIYHTNIIAFLMEQNYKAMVINPILTNMVRKTSKVHAAKNDNLDAQAICKYMIDNESSFTPYTPILYHIQALKSLSRARFRIEKDERKAKMRVISLVQLVFPEWRKLFKDICCKSSLTILKEYGLPQKLARAHEAKVASMLHKRCKSSAAQLIEAAKHSVGLKDECYAFELQDAIEELEHVQRRIERYDSEIRKLVSEICPNILGIPGVGYVTAGLIIGEIGDINRFHSSDSLVSYSGIDCNVYESGKYKAQHSKSSKKGSKYLRYALYQAAGSIRQWDPVFKQYYNKKAAEGKQYTVILGHIQKKLVRVLYSIMKSGSKYEVRTA